MNGELSIQGDFAKADSENLISPSLPVRINFAGNRMIAALKKLRRLLIFFKFSIIQSGRIIDVGSRMRDLQEAEKKNRYDSAATERKGYVLLFLSCEVQWEKRHLVGVCG